MERPTLNVRIDDVQDVAIKRLTAELQRVDRSMVARAIIYAVLEDGYDDAKQRIERHLGRAFSDPPESIEQLVADVQAVDDARRKPRATGSGSKARTRRNGRGA